MRLKFNILIIIIFLFLSCNTNNPIYRNKLAEEVKKEFMHAWNGYKEYAWGHDDLKPLSKGFHDWHEESLLMTPVDVFSTMKIMKLEEEAEVTKNLILENLSFDKDFEVQLFELNIRLLGGLLSAYQLDGDVKFLNLAQDLADRLLPAFETPTGMPYRFINLKTGKTRDPINNPAEIGTFMLEWGSLSRHTGNPVYFQKAKKAVQALYNRRSKIDLVGTTINVETGEWINLDSHISARIDSYYEYLFKSWLMFGDKDFKMMWETSIEAIHTHLADTVRGELWYGRTKMNTGKRIQTYYGALDAFFPAVLALSGDLERAQMLHESNYKMWTANDIEPEMIDYMTMETKSDYYILRPENIESTFYLFYFTKDPKYLEIGKTYLENLIKYCKTDIGYAHLKNVKTKEQEDAMQSFFLAETLKYFYLLFSTEQHIDFNKIIFNTEAHPLKNW